jgi:ABC-type dipeptide/oligopeptide/nickel transport system permease subunit
MNAVIKTPVSDPHSWWGETLRRIARSKLNLFCIAVVLTHMGVAFYGEVEYLRHRIRDTTPAYNQVNLEQRLLAPSLFRARIAGPDGGKPSALRHLVTHPLGTDSLGRDVLQRLVQGARIAFRVGIITSLIAIPIGVILGCLAGYFGGRTDDVIVWVYSTFASIPGLLFILAIAMVVGQGLLGVYLGIGLTTWVGLCRLLRGEVIKHKTLPYVQAARALGLGSARIIFRHILPNVFHIVIVTFSIRFPAAVGTEVILSFLGIGVRGEPSWGIMISNARLQLWQGIWWEITSVTVAIFFLVLAFNILGDALRDALDPRLRDQQG